MTKKPILCTDEEHKIITQATNLHNGFSGNKLKYGEFCALKAKEYIEEVKTKNDGNTGIEQNDI